MELPADFDPLALLEAEYAAVVAQSAAPRRVEDEEEDKADAGPRSPVDEEHSGEGGDHGDSESESDDDGHGGYYALPTSPRGDDSNDSNASDDEDRGDISGRSATGSDNIQADPESKEAPPSAIPADKRDAIMQSMRTLQLAPPPWASAGNGAGISDDELVALVQNQLRHSASKS